MKFQIQNNLTYFFLLFFLSIAPSTVYSRNVVNTDSKKSNKMSISELLNSMENLVNSLHAVIFVHKRNANPQLHTWLSGQKSARITKAQD